MKTQHYSSYSRIFFSIGLVLSLKISSSNKLTGTTATAGSQSTPPKNRLIRILALAEGAVKRKTVCLPCKMLLLLLLSHFSHVGLCATP